MHPFKPIILVVEDHPLVRVCTAEIFVEAGFEALEAADAAEAIQVLEARPDIHLIFTDAEMPGSMDGVKLARYVRDRWPPIKLIVVSGRMPLVEGDLPPGAKFFPKPYRSSLIIESIVAMLARDGTDAPPARPGRAA